MNRQEWLAKNRSKEEEVKRDEGGEYIHGWVDSCNGLCTSFPKIYLPEEFQL